MPNSLVSCGAQAPTGRYRNHGIENAWKTVAVFVVNQLNIDIFAYLLLNSFKLLIIFASIRESCVGFSQF